MHLKDNAEEINETTDAMKSKLEDLTKKHEILMKSMEQIAYRVESKSPHLSEAEECMRTELEGLQKHVKVMSQKIIEVHRVATKNIYRYVPMFSNLATPERKSVPAKLSHHNISAVDIKFS